MSALLQVSDLAKSFGGVAAVDGVSFQVGAGERLALIGPNGAGKTTCFNLLNGQLRADRGSVVLDGQNITGRKPRQIVRLGIGRTFQIARSFLSMTVAEAVETALDAATRHTLSFRRAPDASVRIAELLGQVGLQDQADRPVTELPYGDVKRLDLAMALSSSPRLLFMDEPTAGMAAADRALLMDQVSAIVAASGLAVLFTEHDMEAVFGHADRVIVMARGQLIAEGTVEEIRRDPEVRRVYLGRAETGEAEAMPETHV
ncbi:MAG: ABC transporter ATP-binding protein [Minwuia sp.]|nr:ABC transporter ATP-binding protein [Minwuia sp.]